MSGFNFPGRGWLGLLVWVLPPEAAPRATPPAAATIDAAIDRMGGAAALRRIEHARFDVVTLWHRQTFEQRPFADVVGSYERGSDLRDYTIPAWRNTRTFLGGPATVTSITDLVRDSVAIRHGPNAPGAAPQWAPLNVAYVDERREIFAFTPERLLLAARDAADLRALADTTIDRTAHVRLAATIDGFPATLFIRRTDGFPAFVRYRAAQPNDFGLAPFGRMEVELWFANWRRVALPGTGGVNYPMQWDIKRIGVPYKRITILSARFDAPAPADSFDVTPALRSSFYTVASKPMWDMPRDSARIVDGRFAMFGLPGAQATAVKVGNAWVMLEGSVVPERVDQDAQWLASQEPGSSLAANLVTTSGAPRGGIAWFTRKRLPVFHGSGVTRAATVILRNWDAPSGSLSLVDGGKWVRIGGDSIRLETIHYPGSPGALVAWVPSLRWLYSGLAATPVNRDIMMERAADRGWNVERVGSVRALVEQAPQRATSP